MTQKNTHGCKLTCSLRFLKNKTQVRNSLVTPSKTWDEIELERIRKKLFSLQQAKKHCYCLKKFSQTQKNLEVLTSIQSFSTIGKEYEGGNFKKKKKEKNGLTLRKGQILWNEFQHNKNMYTRLNESLLHQSDTEWQPLNFVRTLSQFWIVSISTFKKCIFFSFSSLFKN